ncbi:arsenic resistance protein [Brucella pituitosa]|uniref:Arsenic resistance protein n=1 Tax=Brucella pituitosa TaxID=571256 RepID=A0ABS3K449_9HYPH|nr:arsenic resistance protein [Brucella pituitosa]MBO1041689.1 arsenic resistance protein [Brucella pituitosa]
MRDWFEAHQVWIYFAAVAIAVIIGTTVPRTTHLESWINPALAIMLFVTFLQVPIAELGRALMQLKFLTALTITNFVLVPLLVWGLIQFLPNDPMIRLGVLIVLLTPCIDYVVTFAHLGKADAKLLLASTPVLLIAQMILLPVYLGVFLGDKASSLIHMGPFIHAFVWLIAIPLALAVAVELFSRRWPLVQRFAGALGLLPVPATALVLFIVVIAVVPQLGLALQDTLTVVPVYITFALLAPMIGWVAGTVSNLDVPSRRAIAFSAGTRNSLVVLPFAFAVPGSMPLLPAIILAQTIVELASELLYMRLLPKLGRQ